MSKVKKGKRVAAAAMAVALSMATVTTGVLPNTEVHVHAEESDRTWTKLALPQEDLRLPVGPAL